MSKDVIIIGAGGHSRVIGDIIARSGDRVYGFLDDNEKDGVKVLGTVDECRKFADKYFIIGIGNNEIRKKIAQKYPDLMYYTAIHPSGVISDTANIGAGTCVMANAVINASARVGEHCIINTHATVEHDNVINDYVHISPGAVLCGTVEVAPCVHIGAGAVVKNNIKIQKECTVGAGAVVVKDIEETGIYVGVPAKRVKEGHI